MNNKKQKLILLSFLLGVIFSIFYYINVFDSWSFKLKDRLFLQGKPSDNIVIITIDNQSLQKFGRWPWNRKVHADIINTINEANPSIIGYDINFPEPSNPEADQVLSEAIKKSEKLILPIEADINFNKKITAQNLLYSTEKLKNSAQQSGLVSTPTEKDGIFRRLPIKIFDTNKNELPIFSKLIADTFLKNNDWEPVNPPLDSLGRLTINFVGKPGTFKTISAADLTKDGFDISVLRNKIILVGTTAADLHDELQTPTSAGLFTNSLMSGVEIHANSINTLITKNFLTPLRPVWQILIFLITSLIIGTSLSLLNFQKSFLLNFFILLTYLLNALVLFDYGIVLEIFYFIIICIFTYFIVIALKFIFSEQEKHFIKNTFSHYVSKEVVEDLVNNPSKLNLGGEKKEVTILFSDIRGFTTISEKLPPEKLVKFLNEFFNVMADIVMGSGGVVDKFIGDCIMAFWGAPLEDKNHAINGVSAGLKMVAKINEKKIEWKKTYDIDLNIGVGINTGEVIIGNLGSDKRFDYTIVGDAVNLASRLEGLNKTHNTNIIISEFTKSRLPDYFITNFLDKVVVKGKTEPVEIFSLESIKN